MNNHLEKLKAMIGGYAQFMILDDSLRYENNKLFRMTKVGEVVEPDRAVRNAGDYKIYARHFDCNLPYTEYMIADTKTGEVFVIPEVVTVWNFGVLKEITDNLINGGPPKVEKLDYDFNSFEGI